MHGLVADTVTHRVGAGAPARARESDRAITPGGSPAGSPDRTIRLLTFTSLYPNAAQPGHGLFVEHRLRQLLRTHEVTGRVIAPVPWFPFKGQRFGQYGRFAAAPARAMRHGIAVEHPRYVVVPKLGTNIAPFLMAAGTARAVAAAAHSAGGFDLIDAHYFYPDGVAAALLGRRLGRPVVITARGSDVNLIAELRLPRRMITWAAREAGAVITVSAALKDRLVSLGVAHEKITVLRNGVDLELFRPLDHKEQRTRLGLRGRVLLSVGNLVELKGHHIAIDALGRMPDVTLIIAGEGPWRGRLEALSHRIGVADRVRFVGRLDQCALRAYYSAADALVLASSREGWPNVLLESMACGTCVMATAVGGIPEVVRAPEAGALLPERSAQALIAVNQRLAERPPSRAATRAFAERYGWEATTRGQIDLFRSILDRTP